MSDFLGPHFLIGNRAGRELYAQIQALPIIDAHNHADVREIAENRNYTDLWQVEMSTDHYVWELLRKRGIDESLITGDASNRAKWRAAAAVWDELAGNPTYEWIYLDLKRILNVDQHVAAATADTIWTQTLATLARPDMTPQNLLRRMGVEAMCSTDDPVDTLSHHRTLQQSPCPCAVRPTFRPDRAMNIRRPGWLDYLQQLEQSVGGRFDSLADMLAGLRLRHDYFADAGCVASDHGVTVPYAHDVAEADAEAVYRKARRREALTEAEVVVYMSYMLTAVAEMDAAKGWVFQLHIGAVRDVRDELARTLGPDTGGDISDHTIPIVTPLRDLLNRFDGRLKMVLYALDPGHQATLAALTRAFGADVSLGSAWWLNDSPVGMKRQLEYIASVDLLMNFAGMVSDSRKLLSYASRHEVFRRVLCDVLGAMVEAGRMPATVAGRVGAAMAYESPKALFGL